MPDPNLSDTEIAQVIAFLDWVSRIDNQGWPPRPILVSGGTFPGTEVTPPTGSAPSAEPVLLGSQLFKQAPATCSACHSTAPGVNLAGPSLAGIGARGDSVVARSDYAGSAADAAGYIRESIVSPSAHVVPGTIYSAGGRSFMPDNYDKTLTDDQIDQLVAYLLTLR
jgi:nitric oxide reductase subunit C